MADNGPKPGFYAGGMVGPVGVYVDSNGNFYPQVGLSSSPFGISASAGYSNDPASILTGPSISQTVPPGLNVTESGGTYGMGPGTKGVGLTYGIDGNVASSVASENAQGEADVARYAAEGTPARPAVIGTLRRDHRQHAQPGRLQQCFVR